MASAETSTCVICLDSLVDGSSDGTSPLPLGAAVPCGHCMHVECWNGWAASRLGGHHRANNTPKCPACNQPTSVFVRLYAEFGGLVNANNAGDDDDDDGSLSSGVDSDQEEEQEVKKDAGGGGGVGEEEEDESEEDYQSEEEEEEDDEYKVHEVERMVQYMRSLCEENEIDNENKENPNDKVEECSHENNALEGNVALERAETIDLTESLPSSPQQGVSNAPGCEDKKETLAKASASAGRSESSMNKDTNSEQRYKRIAKKLKRRVGVLDSQRKKLGNDYRKLVQQFHALEETLSSKSTELEATINQQQEQRQHWLGLQLELTQMRRKQQESANELTLTKRILKKTQQELVQLQESFQQKLTRVAASGMQEVQRMQEERPKMIHEIRNLKEHVVKLERLHNNNNNSANRESIRSSDHVRASSAVAGNKSVKHFLRAVSDCREKSVEILVSSSDKHSNRSLGSSSSAHYEDPNRSSTDGAGSFKMSSHAVRMKNVMEQPRQRKETPGALAALNALDNISSSEPVLPSFLQHKERRTVCSNKRSAPSTTSIQNTQRMRHTLAGHQKRLSDFATFPKR